MVSKNKNKIRFGGYTIIETMISISIFTLIVTFGISTLLNANVIHNKSADMRDIMDNLSFVMEDMSRNLRTGYNYRCFTVGSGSISGDEFIHTPRDCALGDGYALAFEEGREGDPDPEENTDQWVYKLESDVNDDADDPNILVWRSVNSGATWVPMTLPEIDISPNSGFKVAGSLPPNTDDERQPFVTIFLSGVIRYREIETPFALQTTVSQRLIDAEVGGAN